MWKLYVTACFNYFCELTTLNAAAKDSHYAGVKYFICGDLKSLKTSNYSNSHHQIPI
jgi:hypothetical protein